MHLSSEQTGSAEKHVSQSTEKTEAGKPTQTQQDSNDVKENVSSGMQDKSLENANSESKPVEALNRLKNVIKTVTRVSSTSKFVNVVEDKGVEMEGDEKTVSNEQSSVDSASVAHEGKSEVTKSEVRRGNAGRRGESGPKMLKSGAAASKEDASRSLFADDAKLAKQKGESILMNKNGPSSQFPSKNTRELPIADLLFEHQQPRGSLPTGPKHTPPLKDKESLVQVRKCENRGTKKRKGEAFTLECFTKDSSKQEESATDSDPAIEQPLRTTEFSKAATNEPSTGRSDIPALDSDGETVLMKQTSTDEISATASSDSTASERTSEAKVLEISENKTAFAEDVVKSKTTEGEDLDKASANSNKHSEVKSEEGESANRKASDGEIENGKQNDQATANSSENSEIKIPETSNKEIQNGTQLEKTTVSSGENPKTKVPVNSENKAEDVAGGKASDRKEVDISGIPETRSLDNSESKPASADVTKGKASDKKADKGKDLTGGAPAKIITGNRENSSDRRDSIISTPSNVNKELPSADGKSRKTLDAKKASQNIKEQVKNAEFLHSVGAGSSVFETSFMNVHTDGSLQDLSEEECRHIEGVQALVVRNKQFSAWLSLDTKNIE